jgi:protein required for attachment to host cells
MSKVRIAKGAWVLVCDGKKGLVLENVGDEKFLNLKTRQVFDHPDEKTRDIATDAPGRSYSSVGHGRSALEQTDFHTQEEERFLQGLAGFLDAEVRAGHVKRLVVVAPPRALGVLRPAYSQDVRKALLS